MRSESQNAELQDSDPREKVALVTGGARGIGLGITRLLLKQGWRLVVFDTNEEALEGLEREQAGQALLCLAIDVSRESEVRAAVDQAVGRWGRLDAVINNAGVAEPHAGPLENLELERWQRWLDVNLTGTMLMCKYGIIHLRRTRGAIVNIASTRALQSEPDTEAYAASKGGVLAFTHALAMSLAGQVRVNAVSPGWIDVRDHRGPGQVSGPSELTAADHAQHPAGRVGRPQDVASMCAFLVGPDAGFITAQNFIVDGGMTRKMIYV